MNRHGGFGSALGFRSSRGIFVVPLIYRCCTYTDVGGRIIYDNLSKDVLCFDGVFSQHRRRGERMLELRRVATILTPLLLTIHA